jgi:hypothetical protein
MQTNYDNNKKCSLEQQLILNAGSSGCDGLSIINKYVLG